MTRHAFNTQHSIDQNSSYITFSLGRSYSFDSQIDDRLVSL